MSELEQKVVNLRRQYTLAKKLRATNTGTLKMFLDDAERKLEASKMGES